MKDTAGAQLKMFEENKRNYWYAAEDNEIFLDLDSNRATARALSVLRIAIRKKHLPIKSVWLYGTPTKGHAHMIVVLKKDMCWESRLAWSLWLGNDRLRAAYILERNQRMFWSFDEGNPPADLFVTQQQYYRVFDDECTCTEKHKEPHVTEACPAMRRLLGKERSADYFTRTGKAPSKKKIHVKWGKVPLKQIKNWSDR